MPRHGDRRRALLRRCPPLEPPCPVPASGIDDLFTAVGRGEIAALGVFYDRTAPAVFGLLRGALGEPGRAAQATRRVYLQLWRSAPLLDPTSDGAYALLLRAARRELIGPVDGLIAARTAPPVRPGPTARATRPSGPDRGSAGGGPQ